MVRIEQVRLLEDRVQKVIARITELKAENTTLRTQLEGYQDRISDLEKRIEGFASSQDEIEAGILSALQRLDEVEDAIGESDLEDRNVEVLPDDVPREEPIPDDETDAAGEDLDGEALDGEDTDREDAPEEDSLEDDAPEEESGRPGPELDIF